MDGLDRLRVNEVIAKAGLSSSRWLVSVNRSTPRLQQKGPQCGIVALCMALKSRKIEVNVEELMKYAVECGYTKNGEIFDGELRFGAGDASTFSLNSAEYLLNVARRFGADCKLVDLKEHLGEFMRCLLNKQMILIAYDCDRNFEPCFKNGEKAHWALVNGFMLPVDVSHELVVDREEAFVQLDDTVELKSPISSPDCVYTFNLHGKSKSHGLWSLQELLKSSAQLRVIEGERVNSGYVIPAKSIAETLASKALIIY